MFLLFWLSFLTVALLGLFWELSVSLVVITKPSTFIWISVGRDSRKKVTWLVTCWHTAENGVTCVRIVDALSRTKRRWRSTPRRIPNHSKRHHSNLRRVNSSNSIAWPRPPPPSWRYPPTHHVRTRGECIRLVGYFKHFEFAFPARWSVGLLVYRASCRV